LAFIERSLWAIAAGVMKFFLIAAAVLAAGCSSIPFKERPAGVVSQAVAERGETIYFGSSFPLDTASAEPTFIYERRVEGRDGTLVSTHLTRTPSGSIAIAEAATHSRDYALANYSLYANQLGQTGTIQVDKNEVTFRIVDDAGPRTKVEKITGPVVIGPTLVGFIFKNLEALRAGKVIGLRFAVLDRLETIGFEVKSVDAEAGQTRIKMTASGFFISLAVDPIFFTYETATGKLVRLEGRIPPKVRDGDTWANFDARVEYRFVADAYR
jgi:hypothetical protein